MNVCLANDHLRSLVRSWPAHPTQLMYAGCDQPVFISASDKCALRYTALVPMRRRSLRCCTVSRPAPAHRTRRLWSGRVCRPSSAPLAQRRSRRRRRARSCLLGIRGRVSRVRQLRQHYQPRTCRRRLRNRHPDRLPVSIQFPYSQRIASLAPVPRPAPRPASAGAGRRAATAAGESGPRSRRLVAGRASRPGRPSAGPVSLRRLRHRPGCGRVRCRVRTARRRYLRVTPAGSDSHTVQVKCIRPPRVLGLPTTRPVVRPLRHAK
jgi:hypothetical protein